MYYEVFTPEILMKLADEELVKLGAALSLEHMEIESIIRAITRERMNRQIRKKLSPGALKRGYDFVSCTIGPEEIGPYIDLTGSPDAGAQAYIAMLDDEVEKGIYERLKKITCNACKSTLEPVDAGPSHYCPRCPPRLGGYVQVSLLRGES